MTIGSDKKEKLVDMIMGFHPIESEVISITELKKYCAPGFMRGRYMELVDEIVKVLEEQDV